MIIRCLSDQQMIAQHLEDWDSLIFSMPEQNPFLEPDWLLLWLCHFSPKSRPYVLIAQDNARCMAVWPLVTVETPWLLNGQLLTFPGTGLADYQGLAFQGEAVRSVDRFISYLVQRTDWDLLWLPDLQLDRPDTKLILQGFRKTGLKVAHLPSLDCPYLEVSGTWPDYYTGVRSNKARKNLRRSLRQLQQMGSVTFRHYTDPDEVSDVLESTFQLHGARWFYRFTTTPYSGTVGRAFFRDLALAYTERNRLDLATLELDGRPIAFSFSFTYPGCYFYYIPAFNPEYATYSPGTLLMTHLMEIAFENGYKRFDFMKGDEAYKWQWTTTYRRNMGIVVANNTWRGNVGFYLLLSYYRIRGWARRYHAVRWLRREGMGRLFGWAKRIGGDT